ncbi:MAG: hypothetical protein GXO59_03010 [Dictyoglomi bacterium]|nr:hypothetical protein [Dictyoglomota bacterium]
MSQILVSLLEGVAMRLEEKPSLALFIDHMEKCEDVLLSSMVDTLVYRFGVSIDDISLKDGVATVSIEGKTYLVDTKTVPVKSGKGHIAARSIQGVLKKHEEENYVLLSFVYPLPYGESASDEDSILESLKKKGAVYRRPVFIMGRRGVLYTIVPSEKRQVMTVKETDAYIPEEIVETEKTEEDIPLASTPGLLYFRKSNATPDELMDALQHEGAILSDLIKKRTEAVRILGERGLSVVSSSDIATHRLYIADLSGGFGDFIAEVARLKSEGIWDNSVKEVVKAFIKEYERLGVSSDTIKDALQKHKIDIAV